MGLDIDDSLSEGHGHCYDPEREVARRDDEGHAAHIKPTGDFRQSTRQALRRPCGTVRNKR
jgi:hypothetical protein